MESAETLEERDLEGSIASQGDSEHFPHAQNHVNSHTSSILMSILNDVILTCKSKKLRREEAT